MNRRDFYRFGTIALGKLMALVLAVPGLAYLLDPLLRAREASQSGGSAGTFVPVARLEQLAVGVPQSFPIIAARQDAWVSYPREPIGSIWLVRQKEGANPPVVAFTSECPHLGCAVNLGKDNKSFLCPCHNSAFTIEGAPTNAIPPRGMDTLDVELSSDPDPLVRVKFERFRTMSKEKTPLV